jgi:hypothetical protein
MVGVVLVLLLRLINREDSGSVVRRRTCQMKNIKMEPEGNSKETQ